MSPPSASPVLVVGAGPVGLTLACELARRDVPMRVIDRLPEPTTQSRAIVVHARTLEALERLGVVDAFIETGSTATAAELHSGTKKLAHVGLDVVDSPYPFSSVLPQTDTERILAERLRELGATIERGVELVGLEQDGGGVAARLRRADGSEEVAAASWIAGTDGSRSTVRSETGQQLEGSFVGERFVLADVEADHELDPHSIHMFFPPEGGGPFLAFPMKGTRMRIITQAAEGDGGDPTLARVQQLSDERAGGITLRSAHWLTVFEIHHAQVPRYRTGRALLAGDAAHVHSPAGGQGMNTGMQDACNLGWKLAAVVRDGADPALLDSYHDERHPIAARVIRDTTRLTNLGTMERQAERAIRNVLIRVAAGIAPLRRRMAEMTEETDLDYRGSPIVAGAAARRGAPQPGDPAPDVPELGGGTPFHSLLARGAGHTVVHVAPSARAAGGPDGTRHIVVRDAPGDADGADEVVVDAGRQVAARYGFGDEGGTIAVRPDGYIGFIAAAPASPDGYFGRFSSPR
jgi:2-polyprenyl-6-methoxyphenol hydroxylase-like FAD-dependent oxidoreductase